MDRYDRHILEILQADGRISNHDLAARIGLSAAPCLLRVRALEEAGIIRGYHAELDVARLGYGLLALVHIVMDRHTPERFAGFEEAVAQLPQVQECLLITGQQADYQLKVLARDMADYQDILLQHLTRIEGVSGVHTSFVLRQTPARAIMSYARVGAGTQAPNAV